MNPRLSCNRKQKHRSYYAARKAALKLNSSGKARNQVEPYLCPVCEQWHIGRHMPDLAVKLHIAQLK